VDRLHLLVVTVHDCSFEGRVGGELEHLTVKGGLVGQLSLNVTEEDGLSLLIQHCITKLS